MQWCALRDIRAFASAKAPAGPAPRGPGRSLKSLARLLYARALAGSNPSGHAATSMNMRKAPLPGPCLNAVVRPEGFEPPTFGLEVRGSIQLS